MGNILENSSTGGELRSAEDRCKFCQIKIKRIYRLRKHEENCSFQVPKNLKSCGVQISRIKLTENCEILADKLRFVSVEDRYEYNSIANLCVPGIFPLVFSGMSHFGSKPPPILRKTAYNQSFHVLKKLIQSRGEVTLNNHVILVDEVSGTEIYFGPKLLIPDSPKLHIKYSDQNITRVSLKPEEKTDDESSSEGSETDDDIVGLNVEDPFPISNDEVDASDDDLGAPVGRLSQDVLNCLAHMFPEDSANSSSLQPPDLHDNAAEEAPGYVVPDHGRDAQPDDSGDGQTDSVVDGPPDHSRGDPVDHGEGGPTDPSGDGPPDHGGGGGPADHGGGDPADNGGGGPPDQSGGGHGGPSDHDGAESPDNSGDDSSHHSNGTGSYTEVHPTSQSPQPPSPPPPPGGTPPEFPLPAGQQEGLDGSGTLPLHQRKAMCLLRSPLGLTHTDFVSKFKISKLQFINWVRSCENIVLRTRELNYLAQGLLFLHKMLNNTSFSSLAVDFVVTVRTAKKIFWSVGMHQYQHNSNIPRIVFNGATVEGQVNHLLTESFNSTPPLIQNIFRFFRDPSGRGRLPVLLLLDATYLSVQDSTDIFLHKTLFYGPKKDHIVKLVCITNTIGKIVGILPLASSQSPTCGDSFLVGHFIDLEEASPGAQYFRTLIRGNDTFYAIVVTDAGLVTRPSRAGVSVKHLEDVCNEENCILLHTKAGVYHLERDATTGTISKVPPRPELKTREAHTIVISRLVRNVNEQAHAGLKQKIGLLGAKKIPRQFLNPVGARLGTKYGLSQDDHNLPRLSILATVGVGLYNLIHPGFSIKFLDRTSQIALAQIYCSRVNLENPFDHNITWNARLDRNSSAGFLSVRVGDLHQVNFIGFPQLPQEQFNPLVFDLTGGPGPLLGACGILSYMSFRWVVAQNPNLAVSEIQGAIGLPAETLLQYFVQDVEPEGWDSLQLGPFLPCTIVRMKCPPSHKSDSDQKNWKFAVVCFSGSQDSRLSIRGPLASVLYWGCFRCPSDMGLMRTCKHVAALLMVLSFQYAFVSRTLAISLLNPKACAGTQSTHILPQSETGGWSAESLGYERISRDTRRNNLLYQTSSVPGQPSTQHHVPLHPSPQQSGHSSHLQPDHDQNSPQQTDHGSHPHHVPLQPSPQQSDHDSHPDHVPDQPSTQHDSHSNNIPGFAPSQQSCHESQSHNVPDQQSPQRPDHEGCPQQAPHQPSP